MCYYIIAKVWVLLKKNWAILKLANYILTIMEGYNVLNEG
jgi:hypothetical protein